MSEDDLVAGLVQAGFETEVAAFSRLIERPPGEHFGDFGHVFLRVAAVYAERVQFHQLASIVFVQAAGSLGFVASRTLWTTIGTGAKDAPMRLVRGHAECHFGVRADA